MLALYIPCVGVCGLLFWLLRAYVSVSLSSLSLSLSLSLSGLFWSALLTFADDLVACDRSED